MGLIEMIRAKARADRKCIVFPEGDESRTVQAAAILLAEGLAEPVLLGNAEAVAAAAEKTGTDLSGMQRRRHGVHTCQPGIW